jgi:hypothetical protein
MQPFRPIAIALTAVAAFAIFASVGEAQPPRFPLALEPEGSTGEAIWPAYEGWSRNADGSLTLLMGYFNRNEVVVEVPIGEDNSLGPGDVDMGQPTYFLPGRNWGVFAITVPADLAEQKFIWTIRANNQTTEVSFWANPPYFTEPFKNLANGNEPPIIKVGPNGEELQGPPRKDAVATYTAKVSEPLSLMVNAWDKPLTNAPLPRTGGSRGGRRRAPLSVVWKKYRGPGDVLFEAEGSEAGGSVTLEFDELPGGDTMATATFSEPGQYRLMATGNDVSGNGGGGDQCCWTTAHVDVTVTP